MQSTDSTIDPDVIIEIDSVESSYIEAVYSRRHGILAYYIIAHRSHDNFRSDVTSLYSHWSFFECRKVDKQLQKHGTCICTYTCNQSLIQLAKLLPIMSMYVNLQETGLYKYKIHGAMDDMDPELCAQIYVDWEYRKRWDSYVFGEWQHSQLVATCI